MECSGIWHSSGASSSNGEICDLSSRGRGEMGGRGDEEEGRWGARKSEEEVGRMKGREDGGEEEETLPLATKC